MKKFMRIIALTLTFVLLLTILPVSSFAEVFDGTLGGGDIAYYELGDVTGDGVIDEEDAIAIQEFDVGIMAMTDEQIAAGDVNFDGIVDAGDAVLVLRYIDGQIDSFIPAPEIDSAEDMANFFNELTADAENMSYDWSRETNYTESVDFGSTTGVLNSIIQSVDSNASLDSVIGGFLGVGSKNGRAINGEMSDYPNYALKAMCLTKNDIHSWSINDNRYMIRLNDCTNPERNGDSALNHATNDFITFKEVSDSMTEISDSISVKTEDSIAEYKNILLVATVENNELVNLEISYNMDCTIALDMFMTIKGTGATRTQLVYSNFDNGQSNDLLNSFDVQFEYFKTAFQKVKTDASSVTLERTNAYNYRDYVEAGNLTDAMRDMMQSSWVEEYPNTVYTGNEIYDNFPPSGAICNLQKENVESLYFYDMGSYYEVEMTLHPETNSVSGEGIGAVINVVNKDAVAESVGDVPGVNVDDIVLDYEYAYCNALIDKDTGEIFNYSTNSGLIMYMMGYEIGLGFEEDWGIEY